VSRGRPRGKPGATRRVLLLFLAVAVGVAGYWFCARRAPEPAKAPPRTGTPPKAAAPSPRPPSPRPSGVPADFESAGGAATGVLAVLLDDVGYEEAALPLLASLEEPVALSVLPGTPRAAEAVALAKRKGWDLMVHLPMEPETGKAEPNSIGASDDEATIRARVLAALAAVPGAIGLNNHQGSKATADPRVMRAVLAVVKGRGLFFLDSRTTPATVVERVAREMKVPCLARDVFLDDAATEAKDPAGPAGALSASWERALTVAARNGHAVLIAHPHRESVEFLLKALPGLSRRGPRPVRITELLD
jgi:uncharacterized protein